MPYLYSAPGPQEPPTPKDARITHSSGQSFEELRRACLQTGVLFEDADFPANSSSLFYSKRPQIPFVWKRPGEIVKNPEFILGGATRTDICQGELGDCWLLAAIASLTLNESALARVVPPDQSFGPGYAGIFHFQDHGAAGSEGEEAVLSASAGPSTSSHQLVSKRPQQPDFCAQGTAELPRESLLGSAEIFKLLNGSYEALKGGSAIEAMEDFTGGVAETFTTKDAPRNFCEILNKALKRGSLVGCSIDIRNAAESEARTPFGLIKGHAYTVTGVDQVNVHGQKIELIRVRNPWGQVEWNGSWSDSSPEWRSVGPAEQRRLCHTALDNGEFWMAFRDFRAHFDKVEVCNLTPDALGEEAVHRWEVTVHQGSWVRGSTAGGWRNFLDTFWTNPQIKLSLTEKDDGREECTFLVALMQKDRRKLKRFGASVLTIGYAIYQCPGQDEHLNKDFFRYHASRARSKVFINLREVSDRFSLPPGDYILIPSTFEPHQEADFCLRIFSEKKAITRDMDGRVDIHLPEPPKPSPPSQETEEEQQFRALFKNIAGEDMEVTAEELQYILNAVLQKKKNIKFKKLSLISCKNIISLMDTSGNGKLEFREFKAFWEKLKMWTLVRSPGPARATEGASAVLKAADDDYHAMPPPWFGIRFGVGFGVHRALYPSAPVALAPGFVTGRPNPNGSFRGSFYPFPARRAETHCHTARGQCPTGAITPYPISLAANSVLPKVRPVGLSWGDRAPSLVPTGFQLSSPLLQQIVLRCADQELHLGFDDFLNCLVRLENASRVFQALRTKNKEFIHLNINEFIILTMNI
uniref:Calpain-9 n=1 Tax=Camelus bactrianus TaxID=9837 RepID=A0A9W3HPJ4_CAMBA|nr:calpain-9 [Camelus bactrianus]